MGSASISFVPIYFFIGSPFSGTQQPAATKRLRARRTPEYVPELNKKLENPDGESFYFDVQNGVRGYNTDAARGADTFHPFKGAIRKILIGQISENDVNQSSRTLTFDISNLENYEEITADQIMVDVTLVNMMSGYIAYSHTVSVDGNTVTVTVSNTWSGNAAIRADVYCFY